MALPILRKLDRLPTKVTVLVGIPLLLQFLSVGILSWFLNVAEDQTLCVESSREITAKAGVICKLTYDACDAMVGYRNDPSTFWTSAFTSAGANIEVQVKALKKLVAARQPLRTLPAGFIKGEQHLTDKLCKAAEIQLKGLKQVKKYLDSGEELRAGALASNMQGVGSPLFHLAAAFQELTTLEDTSGVTVETAAAARTRARNLLAVGLALNTLVVIVLLILFNRGTVSRLRVLMDNTRLLAHKQPLNRPVAGLDEIADLDHTFHDMAEAMEAARKREQELMEMKKQIVAMVSHDLRAPLTSIQATLGMLNRGLYGDLNDQGRRRVDSSESSARRLISMINDLLDLEKLEAGRMEIELKDVPLTVVVARSIESVQELAANKRIKLDYDQQELEIRGDGDRLIQVIVNLLSNAIKFSPEKAVVKITSAVRNGVVEVRVIDQGPGVPEEYRERIFERYRQIEGSSEHKTSGGTGLGLAICKLIVEQHGGSIGVDSGSGQGSTFWIQLPADGSTDGCP